MVLKRFVAGRRIESDGTPAAAEWGNPPGGRLHAESGACASGAEVWLPA
jgi:hypothetical protein